MSRDYVYNVGMIVLILVCALLLSTAAKGQEHDHVGDVGEFYGNWYIPKGNLGFEGVGHRTNSCCNRTDCSPVIATEMRNGQMYARFELEPSVWYRVDQSIIESNQIDPRETPDGRAHGCVVGGTVRCYVHGAGG